MNQPTALPCNAAQLHRLGDLSTEHGPHEWIVQPGMGPVRCPGAPAVSSAGQAPATNHTDLREQIAETLATAEGWTWAHGLQFKDIDTPSAEAYRKLADAVLAVLPAPTDRAATLREAADQAEAVALRLRMKHDVGAANGAYEVMEELRRLADETPDTRTKSSEPTAEEIVRDHVTALHLIGEQLATIEGWFWEHLADVRADGEPAAGARQDGAES